jgi:hippurate hydrolase
LGFLSITKIDSGDAYNVIPESARMGGTVPSSMRPVQPRAIADAEAELVREANVDRNRVEAPALEDFAFMLERIPGAYINLGDGEASSPVHNDHYVFNDEAIPYGAAMFARLVERTLVPEPRPR